MSTCKMYINGDYLKKHPTWDVEDSPWKAKQIINILKRNNIMPTTICEIGCGVGEILNQLQRNMATECTFWGYEVSPQAFELCQKRANDRLHFELKDISQDKKVFFDLILVVDVLEHLEDYFSFLRETKQKSQYKIFHIPLDLSIQSVFRGSGIMELRKKMGHLHYFTKEIILEILKDTKYEILDYCYTATSIKLPVRSIKNYLARPPRKIFFTIHEDWTVRIMGGYELLILTK